MQVLSLFLDRRYLVLFLLVACVISQPSFPSNLLAPFHPTPTATLAPSKQILSNTLSLVEQWRWSGVVDISVAVEDRIIIISRDKNSSDRRITVFDAGTGNVLWQSEVINGILSVTADEKRVYIGTILDVQAFDLETGQKLWRGAEQPSMKKGTLNVYSKGDRLEVYDPMGPAMYILDSATGQTVDKISKSLFIRWNEIDYSVIRGNYFLEASDAKSNRTLWSYAFPGHIERWPAFIDDIMLLNSRGQIFGLKPRTGEIVWQTPDTQTTFIHPQYISKVALQDHLAYALRYDAAIVGFNSKTGNEVGIIKMIPNHTLEDDKGDVKYYGIATSDRYVAVYYGNSQELLVFEKLNSSK